MNLLDPPDLWAQQAAAWPLAFAQVREDPRIDLEVLHRVREPASVVMIGSGGDTAVVLGRVQLRQLLVVDMNPAQLALCRLKWHLAHHCPPEECLSLLGHCPMDPQRRQARLIELLNELDLSEGVFGPIRDVSVLGPDYAGRYEVLFGELRRELAHHTVPIDRLLRSTDGSASALMAPLTPLGMALDDALGRVMALPNLVRLFGAEATQNPRQPFHRHFAERLRCALARPPAANNPFLWQLLGGRFPPQHFYDWLERFEPPCCVPSYRLGRMRDVLAGLPGESADLVHLSNILDWLCPAEATDCLRCAARVLRPGGCVLVRQLNSTVDIPELPTGLTWDREWSAALHTMDRSFFYTAIHVGRKS